MGEVCGTGLWTHTRTAVSPVLSGSVHPAKTTCNMALAIHQSLACTGQAKIANVMKEAKPSNTFSFSLVIQRPLGNVHFPTIYSECETFGTQFNIGTGRWEVFKLAFWVEKVSGKSFTFKPTFFFLMPQWSRNLSPQAKACSPALRWTSERCGSTLCYLGQGDHCLVPVTGCLNQITFSCFVLISQTPRSLFEIPFDRHYSILIYLRAIMKLIL